MKVRDVLRTLWAMGKLAGKEVDVDAAAVRTVSEQAARVVSQLRPCHAATTLLGWATLRQKGAQGIAFILDDASQLAVIARAEEVAPAMDAREKKNNRRALSIINTFKIKKTFEENGTTNVAVETNLYPGASEDLRPLHYGQTIGRWGGRMGTEYNSAIFDRSLRTDLLIYTTVGKESCSLSHRCIVSSYTHRLSVTSLDYLLCCGVC
jgi:hypothetical protein